MLINTKHVPNKTCLLPQGVSHSNVEDVCVMDSHHSVSLFIQKCIHLFVMFFFYFTTLVIAVYKCIEVSWTNNKCFTLLQFCALRFHCLWLGTISVFIQSKYTHVVCVSFLFPIFYNVLYLPRVYHNTCIWRIFANLRWYLLSTNKWLNLIFA
jgi:hypothetical protein